MDEFINVSKKLEFIQILKVLRLYFYDYAHFLKIINIYILSPGLFEKDYKYIFKARNTRCVGGISKL